MAISLERSAPVANDSGTRPLVTLLKRLAILSAIFFTGACRQHFVEGQLVDYESGEPIPGATVSVVELGWDFAEVVWDHAYVFHGMSDKDGKFRIDFTSPWPPLIFDFSSSAHVMARHSDYVRIDVWVWKDQSKLVRMKKHNPRYSELPNGFMNVGVKNQRPYGWVFSAGRTTFAQEEADVFPVFDQSAKRKRFRLRTYDDGGIAFLPTEQIGAEYDLLVYTDRAPLEGYSSEIELDVSKPGGVYFVRTRDGLRYAKFVLHPPTGYSINLGSSGEGKWELMVQYVYNPSGNTDLQFEPK